MFVFQLDEVLTERRQELKSNHQQALDRLKQDQENELRKMQLEMQEKVSHFFITLLRWYRSIETCDKSSFLLALFDI